MRLNNMLTIPGPSALQPPQRYLLTSSDGIDLRWYSWGEQQGTPVVLQHGFAASAESNWFTPGVVEKLLADGRWVVALDARGHGESGKPHDPKMYGENVMARDVSELIDVLARDHGVNTVDFAGYSMGGYIGVHVVINDPRIRRAAICGVPATAAGSSKGGQVSVNRSAIASAMLAYADNPTVKIKEITSDPEAINFLRYARFTNADMRALAAFMQTDTVRPTGVEHITIPVLVLAGIDDHLARTAPELAQLIPGATLVLSSGDHLSAVAEPDFHEALVTFLRG
jgi:pimeloyl-ACP methyl ester carboxylesterase